MPSVLEIYKAKKAAEVAKGQAAPAIGPAEAPAQLASETQAEVDGAKAVAPSEVLEAPAPSVATPTATTQPAASSRRPRRTKAEMEAARATRTASQGGTSEADDVTSALELLQDLLPPGCVLTIGARPA